MTISAGSLKKSNSLALWVLVLILILVPIVLLRAQAPQYPLLPGGGGGGGSPGGSAGNVQTNNGSGGFSGIGTTGTGNAVLATSPTFPSGATFNGPAIFGPSATTVYSSGTQMCLGETGDVYGTVTACMQNRNGVNGLLLTNVGVPLFDLIFNANSVQENIRFEPRSGNHRDSANVAEWQVGTPPSGSVPGPASGFVLGDHTSGPVNSHLRAFSTNAGGTWVLPALTSCGTSPVIDATATDTFGTVTPGTGATGCVITFVTAYGTAPHCSVSDRTFGAMTAYSVSTTNITLTGASIAATLVDYVCGQ